MTDRRNIRLSGADYSEAVISAAEQLGQDGKGTGGLTGFLKRLALEAPPVFGGILSKAMNLGKEPSQGPADEIRTYLAGLAKQDSPPQAPEPGTDAERIIAATKARMASAGSPPSAPTAPPASGQPPRPQNASTAAQEPAER